MEHDKETFDILDGSAAAGRNKSFLVLVIYDISDNRKRNRIAKYLSRYGVRVQKSAFEAWLTQKQYERLLEKLPLLINEQEDYLRTYKLSGFCEVKTWGQIGVTPEEDDFLVF